MEKKYSISHLWLKVDVVEARSDGAMKTRTLTIDDSKEGKVYVKELDVWVDTFLF